MPVRSRESIEHHFDVERRLAKRLLKTQTEERPQAYTSIYNELFRLVPDHPQLTAKTAPEVRRHRVVAQARFLSRLLRQGDFVEIGAGDCALSVAMAPYARRTIAVDVSASIMERSETVPANLEKVVMSGVTLPLASESVDLVYSDQLMEHLHPDDAIAQIEEIFRVLRPGGIYYAITPNRLFGPHDVTRHFDRDVAEGLHLREYSIQELDDILRQAGFRLTSVYVGARDIQFKLPAAPVIRVESALAALPPQVRKGVRRSPTLKRLFLLAFGIRMEAQK